MSFTTFPAPIGTSLSGDTSLPLRRSRGIIRCCCCRGSPRMRLDTISLLSHRLRATWLPAQGYHTWILEVRGAGLSTRGLLELEDISSVKCVENGPFNIVEVGQRAVTTFVDFQERLIGTLITIWKRMCLLRTHCKPEDRKLLAIGHSIGGILLYARLSRCSSQGQDSGLVSVATSGSSLDYRPSKSSLKLFLPLVLSLLRFSCNWHQLSRRVAYVTGVGLSFTNIYAKAMSRS